MSPVSMTTGAVRRSLAAVLLGALVSPLVEAAVEALTVTTPRPFGYTIGDTIEHQVSLILHAGFELDSASIPEPGRASRWLTLDEAVLEGDARNGTSRYSIRLRYQVVNAASGVIGAGTPPVSLRILGPEDDFPVIIPSWGFTIGPIVTPEDRSPGRLPDLRPVLPPPPIPTEARTTRIAAVGLLALVLIVLVARQHLAGRFGAHSPAHFGRAYRRIERRTRGPESSGSYADALMEMHAAFNATAGRAVFEHDLARFFAEYPRFEPLRARIEALFAESGRLFYGRDRDSPTGARPLDQSSDRGLDRLRDLCRACRDAERRR